MKPTFIPLNYTYKKDDSGLWVLNTDDIPLPHNEIQDRQIVSIPPKQYGGNHSHLRREWFVAIGELFFVWKDDHDKKHEQAMNTDDNLLLTCVPAHLPHAVVNKSNTQDGLLYEFADAKMANVVRQKVL